MNISVQMWTLHFEHYNLTPFLDFPWFKLTSFPSFKSTKQESSLKRPGEFSDSKLSQFRPNSRDRCKVQCISKTQCCRKPSNKGHLIRRSTTWTMHEVFIRLLQTILTQSHWFNYCLLQWLVQTKRLILISCSEQTTSVYRVVVIYFWLLLLVWKLV